MAYPSLNLTKSYIGEGDNSKNALIATLLGVAIDYAELYTQRNFDGQLKTNTEDHDIGGTIRFYLGDVKEIVELKTVKGSDETAITEYSLDTGKNCLYIPTYDGSADKFVVTYKYGYGKTPKVINGFILGYVKNLYSTKEVSSERTSNYQISYRSGSSSMAANKNVLINWRYRR